MVMDLALTVPADMTVGSVERAVLGMQSVKLSGVIFLVELDE